ncbi:Anti-sigma-B factor antagonist [Pseudooceanicola marinus]|uniref:Anti-sigma factor antagonist n=1 Tax=Pseudooceanicola marinus TaxID=396013 RepID=A0A1X6ZDY4_9RHOB|nr:STAS domain-containing protein [Pseudooceanicola marinus]PJE28254.1 anti-sigma factor antagonist [Pseudooceanicola marinus]SLN46926.1 Anti-sigma-B factor antagonist [Pseudooceanicola marinus]
MIKFHGDAADGLGIVEPGTDRLTAANATSFKDDVLGLIDAGTSRLVIDLSKVDFVDSSGIGALVGLLKRIGHRGEIVVSGLSDNVSQMFRITRMDRVFSSYDTAEAALRALRENA